MYGAYMALFNVRQPVGWGHWAIWFNHYFVCWWHPIGHHHISNSGLMASSFCVCLSEVATWVLLNCLKLNAGKTEVLVLGKYLNIWSKHVGPIVSDLYHLLWQWLRIWASLFWWESFFDAEIKALARKCFWLLRSLKKIPHLPPDSAQKNGSPGISNM